MKQVRTENDPQDSCYWVEKRFVFSNIQAPTLSTISHLYFEGYGQLLVSPANFTAQAILVCAIKPVMLFNSKFIPLLLGALQCRQTHKQDLV